MPQSATQLYFAIMRELERRRLEFGIPMWQLCDAAGIASRYWAKGLYPETPSGRQAQWETLQDFVDVLFPEGFSIKIRPEKNGCLPKSKHKIAITFSRTRYEFDARRDFMAEMSKRGAAKGGKARAAKLPRRRRVAIAKQAAKKRWSTPKVEEIR